MPLLSVSFISRGGRVCPPGRRLLAVIVTLLAAAGVPAVAGAATAYVSDELVITFRTGPSTRSEILRTLPSGTPLEVLDRDSEEEWARVALRNGTQGWVRKQYLENEPIARDRLEAAVNEAQRLRSTVTELREELAAVQAARQEAQSSATDLDAEVSQLRQELSEIKRISAGAIETEAANRRLNELNARLRAEMEALVAERDRLEENSQQRWLMIGGGLVLLGLILGAIIKSRPRRSAWT